MNISEFDYFLPDEAIAQKPIEPRNHSKLMVLNIKNQSVEHTVFYDLVKYLSPNDILIFNNTRVIPARLMGTKYPFGGKVEVFVLQCVEKNLWEVLVKPGKKVKVGNKIYFNDKVYCEIKSTTEFGGRLAEFFYEGSFDDMLNTFGEIPLPPYIHEPLSDKERYQTVYNQYRGSVAAPTAGLHFTEEQIDVLCNKGIKIGFITLHVGLGTFRPVQVETIEYHTMHKEYYHIPNDTINMLNQAKKDGNKIIPIGTTSVRALETYAQTHKYNGWSDIFIYPGYKFQFTDALVTNFHLPKSSLLMLVSALAGRDFLFKAYEIALNKGYKFFSFGDAMFINR